MKFPAYKITTAFVSLLLLLGSGLPARDIIPAPAAFSMPPVFKTSMQSSAANTGSPFNMLMLYAGVALGGKQNTAYFLKSRLTLMNKFNLYGSVYFNLNRDRLYFGSVGIGNIVEFSLGAEIGDRTFTVPSDSTFQRFHFKDVATGEDVPYANFVGFSFPQDIISYTAGLTFKARFAGTNYWRGKGDCWNLMEFKWEMLYAPKVGYDNIINVTTEGQYQATTASYEIVDEKVRHWGVRMVADTRLTSKIGMMMEFGLRPGVKFDLNENHRFSGGYLRIGVAVGFGIGGRKALKAQVKD
jgi:hypothetical protein